MRVLADLVKDTTPEATLYLVEILAAQALAAAAYHGRKLNNDQDIIHVIHQTAGYPMLNRNKDENVNVDGMTVARVKDIIKHTG